MGEKQFSIGEKLINDVYGYMGTRPYNEVANILKSLEFIVSEQVKAEQPKVAKEEKTPKVK